MWIFAYVLLAFLVATFIVKIEVRKLKKIGSDDMGTMLFVWILTFLFAPLVLAGYLASK